MRRCAFTHIHRAREIVLLNQFEVVKNKFDTDYLEKLILLTSKQVDCRADKEYLALINKRAARVLSDPRARAFLVVHHSGVYLHEIDGEITRGHAKFCGRYVNTGQIFYLGYGHYIGRVVHKNWTKTFASVSDDVRKKSVKSRYAPNRARYDKETGLFISPKKPHTPVRWALEDSYGRPREPFYYSLRTLA